MNFADPRLLWLAFLAPLAALAAIWLHRRRASAEAAWVSRAIEPRLGLWTLPAGFLENGETVTAGAARETLEEAGARVEVGDLYTLISLPQVHQVYMMFRARLLDTGFTRGNRGVPRL